LISEKATLPTDGTHQQKDPGTWKSGIYSPERIDPKGLWIYRITKGDVTSHTFIKSILSKDSESRGKTTFEVFTLFVLVGKFWWPMQLSGHVAIYQTCGDSNFGNFPTWSAAEGSSNPGSNGATTSGFSESACGAISLLRMYCKVVKNHKAKEESEPFSFVPLLTLNKLEGGSAVGLSVSRCLPHSYVGRGGVIEVRLADQRDL
jgi:hypothetical protein